MLVLVTCQRLLVLLVMGVRTLALVIGWFVLLAHGVVKPGVLGNIPDVMDSLGLTLGGGVHERDALCVHTCFLVSSPAALLLLLHFLDSSSLPVAASLRRWDLLCVGGHVSSQAQQCGCLPLSYCDDKGLNQWNDKVRAKCVEYLKNT